ncbi:hypothetical protein [Agrobacterium sp. Azo12]|uniref:hypothetical protein n=1 Tax=Agrobacterium sp. Azo12 TaxID=3031129 RepID=UPI0023D8A76B|nr:hypothetical protein [Agrobacterium sp. Azo12]MDO5896540.1 hypothetical protein [Agrobacterium sp. Azo12]
MTRRHLSKSWILNFTRKGLRVLVAEDRRLRRKAVAAGVTFRRLRSAPHGIRLVAPDNLTLDGLFEFEAEAHLDRIIAERKVAQA